MSINKGVDIFTLKNFYIADLHLGHANAIHYDNRPYADIDEMYRSIVSNWNNVVTDEDMVYILGDFIWLPESNWPSLIKPLKGQKTLVRGNHDPKEYSADTKACFTEITDYKELVDGTNHVILSHYPMPYYKNNHRDDWWMLYGHVHKKQDFYYLENLRHQIQITANDNPDNPKGQFINVGCMMPWMSYTPRTLSEIVTS